jgi:hypothetical protein
MDFRSYMRRVTLIAAAVLCNGCFQLKTREMADGRILPETWAGAPISAVAQDKATNRLRYDALYVCDPIMLGEPPTYSWMMPYFRFWPGGQVLEKPRYGQKPDSTIPAADDGDDFRGFSTGVGRYTVVGDELTMVFLGVDEGGWRWRTRKARMNADGSFTFPADRTTGVAEQAARPHTTDGMRRFPDW